MAGRQDRGWKASDNRDNSLRALLVAFAGAGTIAVLAIVIAYAASNGQVSDAMTVTKTGPAAFPEPEAKVADNDVHEKSGYTEKDKKNPVYSMTGHIDSQFANEENAAQPAPDARPAPDTPPSEPAEGDDILQTVLEPLTKVI